MNEAQKIKMFEINPDAIPCDVCEGGHGSVFPPAAGSKLWLCCNCEEELRVLAAQSREEFGLA